MVSKSTEAKRHWEARRCVYQGAIVRANEVDPATRVVGVAAAMESTRNGRVNYANALRRAGRLGLSPEEAKDGLDELVAEGWLTELDAVNATAMLTMPAEPWRRVDDQPTVRIATLRAPSTTAPTNTSFWAGKGRATA